MGDVRLVSVYTDSSVKRTCGVVTREAVCLSVSWERRASLFPHDPSAREECLQAVKGVVPPGVQWKAQTTQSACVCSGEAGVHTCSLCFFSCLSSTEKNKSWNHTHCVYWKQCTSSHDCGHHIPDLLQHSAAGLLISTYSGVTQLGPDAVDVIPVTSLCIISILQDFKTAAGYITAGYAIRYWPNRE